MEKRLRKRGYKLARLGLVLLAVAGLGAGCSNAPGTTYQLTPDQLAWQPYQTGQVLRFGNSRTPLVRTYRVLSVEDAMLEGPHSNGLVVIPFLRGKDPDQFQQITVSAVRSDSAAAAFEALSLAADPNYSTASNPDAPLDARAGWDRGFTAQLPIAEINQGVAFDTLGVYQHTRLRTGFVLGAVTYPQVIEVRRPAAGAGPVALYYAKGAGVVGFRERSTGLWYRLP